MAIRSSEMLMLLAAAAFAVGGAQEQCHGPTLQVKTSSLVQKGVLQSHARVDSEEDSELSPGLGMPQLGAVQRSKAEDARFLMQATFGPTRASLADLQGTTYASWIQQQMALPAESHREHYRQRVNPHFHSLSAQTGSPRSPCAKGSRWHNYAFTFKDVGKSIKVQGSEKIFIDGVLRTEVEGGQLASSWVGLTNYTGFVCYVVEALGADVHLTPDKSCRQTKTVMPNAALWLSTGAVETGLAFESVKPGTLLLKESSASCNLDQKLKEANGSSLVIKTRGKYYRHASRLELLANTRQAPLGDVSSCAPKTFLNERSCRTPTFSTDSSTVVGLKAEVYKMEKAEYISKNFSGELLAEVVDPLLNHSNSYSTWPGFPNRRNYFAVRWTGTLTVQKSGAYDFWINSDDGSRMSIDGTVVVKNDGVHGMRERHGNLTLSAGGHSVVIEYFQGTDRFGMIFQWNGSDTGFQKVAVPSSALSTQRPSWKGCFLACGSPGEVANDPALGHQLPMWTSSDSASRDVDYDSRYFDRMGSEVAKSTVWTMKALHAKDQLRQRMAWALSQIFVVSTQGIGDNHLSEIWLSYFDIFVRNAFGNFRDVLQQVTYNPLMGRYLTHTGSSSYKYNRRFPNENYAREVMQLFTIGLDKMNPDGSVQMDAEGRDIPTYTTRQILDFARVFTGFVNQPARKNVEYRSSNLIDPMRMDARMHDVYPKPDLDGNYIGDGYPLCGDKALAEAFLAKGARYEFRGPHGPSNALALSATSALRGALAGTGEFAAVVSLPSKLSCTGEECSAGAVRFVKVGGVYYEYVPPPCVHTFFRQATPNETVASPPPPVARAGYCATASGGSLGGSVKLDSLDVGDTPQRREECLTKCRGVGATGCMLVVSRWNKGCYAHTRAVDGVGGTDTRYTCWAFNESGKVGHSYVMLPRNTVCPAGTQIATINECREALLSLGLWTTNPWIGHTGRTDVPVGCSWNNRLHWNTAPTGKPLSWIALVCRAHAILDEDGQLVAGDGATTFAAPWLGGAPAMGAHPVLVKTGAAFDKVPNATELLSKLRVGALAPAGQCSKCDGEVKAYYGSSGKVDAETVFELGGRFYVNVESIVSTLDGTRSFRNPPVFLRSTSDPGAERAAIAEVEALLDHLFHHSNTPVFIAKRLIQRFVTSNPSPQYIQAVGEAFRSGQHGGATFSGAYGDLGATVAAVLLHPEARGQVPAGGEAAHGALREPMLKVVHLLRSMEYQDRDQGQVVLRELQEVIGQFPYQSPSVFNFYMADYELPMSEPEPEPEPEPQPAMAPEPEPEPEPRTLVAPEFQIFTPPYFVGYLNGMASLIQSGASDRCDKSGGMGVYTGESTGGRWRDTCPGGELTWRGSGTANETLEELDLLLTGHRLSPVAQEVVRAAYEEAPPAQQLQAAQQAIVMTPEFNTLGAPLPLQGARAATPHQTAAARRPYKAAVMLFLNGGADTWNMLVPQNCELYQEYRDIRTDLALSPGELIGITTSGQTCADFGVHARFRFLKELYDQGDAAFISNVGALVEPTTMQQFKSGEKRRCFGLFSHSDQQNAAQTLKCQELGTSARGAGGRVADALASGAAKYTTTSFSLAGTAIWSQGLETPREIVDQRGSKGFAEFERWRGAIGNITAQRHGNVYAEAYTDAFLKSIETTQNIGRALDGVKLMTDYKTDSGLQRELEQVAKLIRAREGRGAERDFFFVQIGGWDMHSDMKMRLDSRFNEIDNALRGFVAEMKAQQVWDSVVLATESEFARTLDSNGGGSDHAWAGNQFVISGDLKGQRVFNKFPASLKAGNDHDLGRGRLIPDFPWESMMVPIAEWMGMEAGQRAETFPNLGFFNSSHIIAKASLFKS